MGADAQFYAWAQGAHVQVGANIEDGSVAWLMDKLNVKPAVGVGRVVAAARAN